MIFFGAKGSEHAGEILHGRAGSLWQVLGLSSPGQRVTVLSAVPNRSKASNAKDQNDDAEAFLPVPHLVDKELARPLRQRTLKTT